MIHYALACERGHEFESWFPSSDAYEDQAARGFVTCPICDTSKVSKRIMAPSVARRDKGAITAPVAPAADPAPESAPVPAVPQPMALLSEREQQMRAMLRAIREHVTRTADHVGPGFSEEARKMHYGEIEHRSIYGEATLQEAQELLEEGIEVQPLPLIPNDRN